MMEEAASRLERAHVHSVYDKIAPYFNDSRYKAWPKVRQFLLDLEPGSIVADIGCGNGKYLHINKEVFKLGCDVCRPLVDFAWSQGHEVQMCDGLQLPYRDGCFDAVLSIAVIHHLSTKERRLRAIREMARSLRVGGRLMIYVWAMEQKRRHFEKQDVFVPWNPNPQAAHSERGETRRRRAAAQSVSKAPDNQGGGDKHRKVRSTSSVADEEDLSRGVAPLPPQQQRTTQRLWFFSRSLDSVFDFGNLSVSRSSSRDMSSLSSPTGGAGDGEGSRSGHSSRERRGLIKQVSSFFSPSVIGSEEDVFDEAADLHGGRDYGGGGGGGGEDRRGVSVSLAQECGSLALPDLVPFQKEHLKQSSGGDQQQHHQQQHQQQQESTKESPEEDEGPADASCLRYYHVFREGELAELIQNHVEELHVTHAYFDHANWCVVAEKVQAWKI